MAQFAQLATEIMYEGRLASSLDQFIRTELYQSPQLNSILTVFSGIKGKQKVPYLGNLRRITKAYTACGEGQMSKAIPMSERSGTLRKHGFGWHNARTN